MTNVDPQLQARRDDIDARARQWLAHIYSGEITEQERAGFQDWLAASSEHRAAFQSLNELWTSLDRVPHIEDEPADPAARVPADAAKPARWREVLHRASSLRMAAGLIVAVTAVVALATLQMRSRAEQHLFTTQIGEIRELDLTDGSKLVLRADSAISSSMSSDERNVTIERGGAYFDVSRDETRPFVVSAGDIDVRVHGTAFDVLKGPSSVTVSVTHGHVTVSDLTKPRSVQLTGGQQLTVLANGEFGAVVEFDSQRVLGWREGRFSYRNARLEDIVADVNRYRIKKIVIEDEALADLRITTMFRAENVDQMLAGIAATEPVTIVHSAAAISIRRREQP
ncbi:FecR domain-containing protein [Steroidobacter sp. S1-65]|uniref:FecR domain-containing protein n=1 Tax=Steroidobacter gossypii TaxID=2805490 RepID=A0ABS1X0Q0_9GAMM|nr:FecR domain-containing protein [Steroidobacter gossypii]MBM0106820.1 FecR domain-containing protein [Steroidobacter gossypii]